MESANKLIPNLCLKNKVILAPMVRINTTPFRLLSLKYGADLVFTEEIIAKKLRFCEKIYNPDLKTNDYLSTKEGTLVLRVDPELEKHKLILQIGVSNPEDALQAVLVVKDDIIGVDVNMGCPKHFSTHGMMGSALLHNPKNLVEKSGLPVSCKIRLLEDKEKTKEFIECIQSTGIKFFSIHLRKKDQQAKFKANWKAICDIEKYAKIPFNVNGDILSPLDIYKLSKSDLCNGFLLARGAIHNPKIFEEFKNFSLDDYLLQSGINFSLSQLNDYLDNDYDEIEDKNTKSSQKQKESKIKTSEDDVKVSNKLSTVFDKKYNKQSIDIIPVIKDYVELAMKCGNNILNTKYVILYILKTHKKHMEVFNVLHHVKNYETICRVLGMREIYEDIIKDDPNIKTFWDSTYLKERFKSKQMEENKSQLVENLIDQNLKYLNDK